MMLMKSWVESANSAETDFPLNNLPYGCFSSGGGDKRCGVALGDNVIDLALLESEGLLTPADEPVFGEAGINSFMALGPKTWSQTRARLIELFSADGDPVLRDNEELAGRVLVSLSEAELHMPFCVAEFTDFFSGRKHAENAGSIIRGTPGSLLPNWLHLPVAYNSRASTVVVSDTDIRRPLGQMKPPHLDEPVFGPCKRLDIELEMGAVIGTGNEMGSPLTVEQADDMIFGYVILNDWSARDIQAWEYQPLGPFLAKAFASTISPWVVTKEALESFRVSTPEREEALLPYLQDKGPMLYDINLEVAMQPAGADKESVIARTNYNTMYYSSAQQLAHHAIGGCRMNTGDLLGTGTISGEEKSQFGSLLELSWGGKEPFTLDTGETRSFIEDGDRMILRGHAQGDGYRIGFGECAGTILPAPELE